MSAQQAAALMSKITFESPSPQTVFDRMLLAEERATAGCEPVSLDY